MNTISTIFHDLLDSCERATDYAIARRLDALFPDKNIRKVDDGFYLDAYLRYGLAEATFDSSVVSDKYTFWNVQDGAMSELLMTGVMSINWQGNRLSIVRARRERCRYVEWIVGDDSVVDEFCEAVFRFSNVKGRVQVYGGWWSESHQIAREIQNATWDELVISPERREMIERNAIEFFGSEKEYEALGIPWKRGLLLAGAPGNGKTQVIRVLMNSIPVTKLIIRTFGDDIDNVDEVFQRVRAESPCILVMEDLDSLVPRRMLSPVLNQLDGAERLHGVLIIATTNHLEKLDPALRNRPSRFDRVVAFENPSIDERVELLRKHISKLKQGCDVTDEQLRAIAEKCADFSFAYLKELAVSAIFTWNKERTPQTMAAILESTAGELREQMEAQRRTAANAQGDDEDNDEDCE